MRKFVSHCFGAAGLFVGLLPAAAADLGGSLKDTPPVAAVPSPWQMSFTTYGWATWMSGNTAVKGRSLTVEATPKDIINALDWSQIPVWMSSFEARNGRFSVFNDIVYAKLTQSTQFVRAAQGRFASASLAGRIEADFEQVVVEFGAGYQVWSSGSAASSQTALDLIVGGRYWYQNASVSADLTATVGLGGALGIVDLQASGGRVIARSNSIDWIDPFIGAKLRHQVVPGQAFNLRGDVGGFGVGSDFTWQTIATMDWRLFKGAGYTFDAYLGYRALSVDYSKGSGTNLYRFDAIQHGPVLGGTVRF